MRDIRRYDVYCLADRLALEVYRLTRAFPREEMFGLSSQMRRAALSVPLNLVEGAARNSSRDFAHFIDIALGSCEEIRYQIHFAQELGYIDKTTGQEMNHRYEAVSMMLGKLRNRVRGRPASGVRSERREAKGEKRRTANLEENDD